MSDLAVVNDSTAKVLTFVREDTSKPAPDGYHYTPREQLTVGWQFEAESQAQIDFKAKVVELAGYFDDFQAAEDNWGLLTALQIQGLVRKHNLAFLRIKPLLRRLYQQEIAP